MTHEPARAAERDTGCCCSGGHVTRLCPLASLSTLCVLLLVACVSLSVLYKNEWDGQADLSRLLDYQNMSEGRLALARANADLQRDNAALRVRAARLDEQNRLLGGTAASLRAANLALRSQSGELAGRIVNLTSANLQLVRGHERLARHAGEQEARRLNMSRAIERLAGSGARLREETRRLSEVSGLLRDELLQVRRENRELADDNRRCRVETRNLSSALVRQRREAASAALGCSANESYRSLDLYCPVVNQKTKERICKKCQDSWTLFETKCYYFSTRLLPWSAGRAWCRTQGGDLLVVDSEREQRFVFDASREPDRSGAGLWIGATDAEEEGVWRWVDGSEVASDVRYWLSGPDLGSERGDPLGEDCARIDNGERALTSWTAGPCRASYRWICEKNV